MMNQYEDLPTSIWLKNLPYPGLVLIKAIGDGSCFFHAILRAFYPNYYYGNHALRKYYAQYVRYSLANKLTEVDCNGKYYYDILSNGQLRKISKECQQLKCSLEEMVSELKSDQFVGNHYHELISEQLNKDIYIIDLKTQDVYSTAAIPELLYKKRDSIFIGYDEERQHFDVIGVRKNNFNVDTLLQPNHQFTLMVNNRLKTLSKM